MATTRLSAFRINLIAFSLVATAAISCHAQGRFTISADGLEVSDSASGLIWQRCAEGMRWNGTTCAGKPTRLTFAGAKKAASEAASAGAKAWRVPTKEELLSLVDVKARRKPRIDGEAFPRTPSLSFWAVRAGSNDNLNAWLVNFANGKVLGNIGQVKFPLRLVRAGH